MFKSKRETASPVRIHHQYPTWSYVTEAQSMLEALEDHDPFNDAWPSLRMTFDVTRGIK